ncbi:hypothetical protein GYMLUDRAFT_243570 [Collybiopsis luxurians FD-317 M1]|uniref:LysM domain-containing protein n=1 Tax=Collybiopsis luxurians FD-317 M1 TaxID=944289 RepID=A0A0D0CQQ4_9AGAR|nr:hypothetical protein GYMLUDRAFT_243570 [Collybiopsis luxurians FD-317 M1]
MFARLSLFALVASLGALGTSAQATCNGPSYTVVPGDICITIANKLDISLQQLLECNPQIDANCDNLIPTEHLATPGCGACKQFYTVQAGDICVNIAARFGTTFQQLLCANSQINPQCTNLQIGELIDNSFEGSLHCLEPAVN